MNERDIYVLRQRLDVLRQPGYADRLRPLFAAVAARSDQHPYNMTFDELIRLGEQCPDFAHGPHGWSVPIGAVHLYRLCSIGDLVRSGLQWYRRTNDAAMFEWITEELREQQKVWLPLRKYARGQLSNYRGFSWWTPTDLTGGDIWTMWRRIGLLDDWIMHHMVILRFAVTPTSTASYVPTALDAFEGPVFEAAAEVPHSPCGHAIDLSGAELQRGAQEFLVGKIPVAHLEATPIQVPSHLKSNGSVAPKSPVIWRRLAEYYRRAAGDPT